MRAIMCGSTCHISARNSNRIQRTRNIFSPGQASVTSSWITAVPLLRRLPAQLTDTSALHAGADPGAFLGLALRELRASASYVRQYSDMLQLFSGDEPGHTELRDIAYEIRVQADVV